MVEKIFCLERREKSTLKIEKNKDFKTKVSVTCLGRKLFHNIYIFVKKVLSLYLKVLLVGCNFKKSKLLFFLFSFLILNCKSICWSSLERNCTLLGKRKNFKEKKIANWSNVLNVDT